MRVLAIAARIDRPEATLFRAVKESGAELDIVYDATDPSAEALRQCGIPIDHLLFRSRLDVAGIGKLRRKLKGGAFDIVHSFTNRALSNALFASIGLPPRHVTYRGTVGHLERWNPASWMAHLNPRIDRVICVSDAVRQYLVRQGLPPRRLVTIYKGHDPAWYDSEATSSRDELGFPGDAFVVGFVGRIRPVKGVDVLLRALALLPPELNVHLLLIGAVADKQVERLLTQPEIASRTHCTGYREDAAALMRHCDIFAMPSIKREGLPRAVIEAMTQGVPPIVSDVGGMPELVSDGECGLVFPPRAPEALAEAIRELAQDAEKRKRFGKRARERIATQFNVSAYIKQTLALYGELCSPTRC